MKNEMLIGATIAVATVVGYNVLAQDPLPDNIFGQVVSGELAVGLPADFSIVMPVTLPQPMEVNHSNTEGPIKTVDITLADGSDMTVHAVDVVRVVSVPGDPSVFKAWISVRPSSRGPSELEFTVVGDITTFRAAMRVWAEPQ
jgi:hypothetical protein